MGFIEDRNVEWLDVAHRLTDHRRGLVGREDDLHSFAETPKSLYDLGIGIDPKVNLGGFNPNLVGLSRNGRV